MMGNDDNTRSTHKYGLTFKKLSTSEDYPIWRQHMEYALTAQGLWDYVNGLEPQPREPQFGYKLVAPTIPALQLKKQLIDHQAQVKAALDAGQAPPTDLPALISKEEAKDLLDEIEVQIKERKIWREADHDAQSMISYMVTPSALQPVMASSTSKELWDNLEMEYEVRGPRVFHADFKILMESRISDFKTPVEYVKAITEASSRLKQMRFDVPDHMTVQFLQYGLTPEWNSVKARYMDRRERDVSLQEMKNLILQGIPDPSRASKPTATAQAQYASSSAPQRGRFSGTCDHCQKVGHKEKSCWIKHPELKKRKAENAGNGENPSKRSRTEGEAPRKEK
jgi:hypothetical protein